MDGLLLLNQFCLVQKTSSGKQLPNSIHLPSRRRWCLGSSRNVSGRDWTLGVLVRALHLGVVWVRPFGFVFEIPVFNGDCDCLEYWNDDLVRLGLLFQLFHKGV